MYVCVFIYVKLVHSLSGGGGGVHFIDDHVFNRSLGCVFSDILEKLLWLRSFILLFLSCGFKASACGSFGTEIPLSRVVSISQER